MKQKSFYCTNGCMRRLDKLNKRTAVFLFFGVLLTVHLSIFISVFNQLDAQNLLQSKFYFMPLHVSSTCARHTNKTGSIV